MKARQVAVGVRSRLAAALERGGLVCSLIGLPVFRDLSMSKCLPVSPAALSTNSKQRATPTPTPTLHRRCNITRVSLSVFGTCLSTASACMTLGSNLTPEHYSPALLCDTWSVRLQMSLFLRSQGHCSLLAGPSLHSLLEPCKVDCTRSDARLV